MINAKKMSFTNWTEYDDWLVKNYAENSIFKVNEVDGKIEVEYCDKSEFQEEMKREDEQNEQAAKSASSEETVAPVQKSGASAS